MNDDRVVEALLAEWLDRDAGTDVEEFIARHPEHEALLREHFALEGLAAHAFTPRPALPETLGPFRIEKELGSGGMGTVYRAVVAEPVRGIETGRTVALKVVHPHLFRTPGFFKRFLREAELGRRIDHPNVVRTLDADAVELGDRPQHYLVMEYVEGQTLRDLMDDIDRVPEELARHVGCEVAKALSAIHATGAVHRDLKPENVLITPDHEVKVMDLGVARLADEAVRLSQTGAFVGSLHYAAPEQFGGGADIDARADLHGLGVLLYEIATGTNPFADEDVRVVMRRILQESPRKVGELNPQLSPFFEELLVQLLAKDPTARFDCADDVLAILDDAEQSTWWRTRAKEIRATSKRPLRRIRVPRETAVYGRDTELAQLRVLYDAAKSGDGRVVLVEGEAGIGKTRLVDEFVSRLRQEGDDVNSLFASYPPGGAATASGAFSAAYREHIGDEGLDDALVTLLPQTPILVPAFAALLRGDAAPDGSEPLTKDSLQTCFVHLTRNLATERTTIVLIDDLHFAPEEGRALFTSVALAVPGHRVLLIGTMRPGVPEDWTAGVTRLDQTTHLGIARLGPKDLVRLLSDSFKSERLAEELSGKIAVKSDGNPFFAFEIIRGLREGQFITQRDDGTWASTRLIEDIQVPSSVLDLVNARVADLDDDDRNLLDIASCWGYEFDPSLIAAALGQSRLPVLQRLAKIEKHDRLVRSIGRSYAFDHHQVQEALYGALNEQLREEYHVALADALETRTDALAADPSDLEGGVCLDLSEHFLRGAAGERAIRYFPSAQAHLERAYLHGDVVALTERALAATGLLVGVDRARAHLELAQIEGPLDRLGHWERQAAHALEARRIAEQVGSLRLAGWATAALAVSHQKRSQFDEAEREFRHAIEVALACGDEQGEASAISGLGHTLILVGRLSDARHVFERQLALGTAIDDASAQIGATGALGMVACEQGQLDEAQRRLEEALIRSREAGNRWLEVTAAANLSGALHARGRIDEARALNERSLALCVEIGDRGAQVSILNNLGRYYSFRDRLAEAEEFFRRSLTLAKELGSVRDQAIVVANLGGVAWSRGRLEQAKGLSEQALATARQVGDAGREAYALYNLGWAHRELGESAESAGYLDACMSLSEKVGDRLLAASARRALGSLRSEASGRVDGRGLLLTACEVAEENGFPAVETLAKCELALVPGGDVCGAIEALRRNDERLRDTERREAHWLLWLATGDREHLDRAKRSLDTTLARVPEEYHEGICRSRRVNREIVAAWRREFGEDDERRRTESVTQVGPKP